MGAGETLVALISALSPDEVNIGNDIDLTIGDDIDVGDLENSELSVESGEQGDKLLIEQDRCVIYPDQLQGDEYALFNQLAREIKRESGSVDRTIEHEQTRALEATDTVTIDDIVGFFDGIISEHYLSLLRSSLYLRQISENNHQYPDFDINEEKRELKDRYGYEAYYVAHLASSGYFDQDRYFQNLHDVLESRTGNTPESYRREFEITVGEKLIAVFVNEDDSTYEVEQDFRAAAYKQQRYNLRLDFVDICGFGSVCQSTIDEFVEELEDQYPTVDYENLDRGQERVVRIYPATLNNQL
ncbi:hypothetical protein ACOZ4I_16870 [Haloarcula salina]|uniref:hypothetical protein n=1 Tax=Haloarcula salina TaxID=1429914 RepID=UPI003C70100C